MRCVLIAALLHIPACGHEELDFALPDGGRDGALRSCDGPSSCTDGASTSASDAGAGEDAVASAGRVDRGSGSASRGATDAGGSAFDPWAQADPDGYPTQDGQWAPWCDQMQSFSEVCGTDIDEDCDGMVDEFAGLGLPCASGCHEGIYVCDPVTNSLLCRGVQGCMVEQSMPCGDGFVGAGEECDPAAPHEQAGATCTLDCRRPLFVRCVMAGVANPDLCDELHACNERIGACMPVIGPRQPRCPNLRVEGSDSEDEFYPMLETENGECWITCSEADQCPSTLSECYMGFCAVPL